MGTVWRAGRRWGAGLASAFLAIALLAGPASAAPNAPGVTVTPSSAVGGTTVTLAGSGFAPGQPMAIKCDNKTMITTPAVVVSDASGVFSATAVAPTGQPGQHTVQVSDGTKTASTAFQTTLAASISKTTTEAAPGNVGMELTVNGSGFASGAVIKVITDSEEETVLATTGADAAGNFDTSFAVPAMEAGAHTISVTDGTNVRRFAFFMDDKAPVVPALVAPRSGSRADRPLRFEWKPVTDPSGVTYTLQVSTSADFTDPVLDKTGLTAAGYSLAESETLKAVIKETPYYWRVQAIDNAGNQSAWSAASSFSVGTVVTLPNGEPALTVPAVMVYVDAAAVIALLGLSFWLGRRSARRRA